jgi:hypothetical protein
MKIPSCFRLFTIVLAVTLGGVVRGAATAPKAPSSLVAPIVLDLAPGPGNPRNSEGAFLELKNGSILFVYSRFVGTSFSDEAKARLAGRHSADGGETWSKDTLIETPEENDVMNVMSVSLLRFGNGDVGLFYLLRRSWHDMRMWCRRSTDEGRTWGAAIQCMPAAGYYVVNNDRVVRLASGRLVIPAAVHPSLADRNASSAVDWRGVAEFFLSDDDGRTWRKAKGYGTLPGAHTRSGLQEPGVVELRNGVLWAWARTDLGRQYECFSHDGGETWSVPAPSRFTSPNSPLSMKHLPGSDRLLAIWNPGPSYETRSMKPIGGDRTPLVLATGVLPAGAWSRATLLDGMTEADEGYCYTAIHFTKDAVLLAYCAGGEQDKNRLARLRMRKLPLSALK